jgi:putative nucleotidyltransferase with HDIG domain
MMNEIFPVLERISNSNLMARTIGCWEESLRRGGWIRDDLERIPFTLLPVNHRPSLAVHTNSVAHMAIALAESIIQAHGKELNINMDFLISGALLHDVGKAMEFAEVDDEFVVSENGKLMRHPVSGAALAAEIGLPVEIQHIIATHSYEGDKVRRSVESVLVHHADFANFESLGGRL